MLSLAQKNVAKVLVALTVVLGCTSAATSTAQATEIDFSTYAAVAFSKSTGEYGYAWDQSSYGAAARVALSNCKAKDAEIVGWVQGGWLVLAIGEDDATYGVGWEYGDGATNTDAQRTAKNECNQRGQKVKMYVVLCSGDINPRIIK